MLVQGGVAPPEAKARRRRRRRQKSPPHAPPEAKAQFFLAFLSGFSTTGGMLAAGKFTRTPLELGSKASADLRSLLGLTVLPSPSTVGGTAAPPPST